MGFKIDLGDERAHIEAQHLNTFYAGPQRRHCPDCLAHAIADAPSGFLCDPNRGGCERRFATDDKRITEQERVPLWKVSKDTDPETPVIYLTRAEMIAFADLPRQRMYDYLYGEEEGDFELIPEAATPPAPLIEKKAAPKKKGKRDAKPKAQAGGPGKSARKSAAKKPAQPAKGKGAVPRRAAGKSAGSRARRSGVARVAS